jgi:hypothetical protein
MYLFYMALGLNDFDGGNRQINYSGHWKWWGQMALASLVAISWPQKVLKPIDLMRIRIQF